MKKTTVIRSLAMAFLVFMGCMAANASTALAPYGQFDNQAWSAKYYYALNGDGGPAGDWYAADFDDTVWETIQGPISMSEQWSSFPPLSFIGTVWQANNSSYWVRRHFTVEDFNDSYKFYVIHDDACTAYLNGVQIYNNSSALTYPNYNTVDLRGDALKSLKKGDNVLAVYVSDGTGQALMDFGLYGYDLDDIVTNTDVAVTFTNDATYPWIISGTEARNGNYGKSYSTSWLTMQYSSNYRTELMFDWYEYNYSQHQPLQLYIDGVQVSSTNNSSWNTVRFYVDAGDHIIAFRDSIGNSTRAENRSGVRNVKIREIRPLETAVLTELSQPLSFVNESAWPWTIEDGFIQNGNYGKANTTSRFSTTFTVDKTSKFSYEVAISASSSNNNTLNVYVNGILWDYWTAQRDWTYDVIGLEPGTYTIEWEDTLKNTTSVYYSRIRNVELSNNWIDVELATAGTLGYEVLYSGKADVLTDVEFLKISGPMNAADWTDIKNMTSLLALDLSEAQITEIPNNAFKDKSRINSVILPEGLTRIGEYAFQGTNIRRVNIPSTVTNIARYAFCGTPLQYVTFADNSQLETINRYAFQNLASLQSVDFGNMTKLKTIGYSAFADCPQLKEFIMPNSATDVSYYMFNNNTSMTKLHISDGLSYVPDMICRNCTALTDVHLPVNAGTIRRNAFENCTALRNIAIPESVNLIQFQAFYNCGIDSIKLPVHLTKLGHQAFQNCKNLKYAEMPSYISTDSYSYINNYNYWGDDSHRWYDTNSGWDNTFQGCSSMEKIIMRSATPPEVKNDIMNGGNAKANITLVVPSFAVVSYKLDTYWYQFGTIIEGDDVDYWKITSPLMLTNNRRMQGKPDVDLYYGGQLTVGGNAPFPMGQFNMYVNESNPGRLLNTCENMTADAATTKFAVDANKWYFFTPIHDVTVADIEVSNNASYVFRYYDAQNRAANGASGSWKNVDTDKLLGGQGYIFHCNTACTITFPADVAGQAQLFKTTDVTRALTANESETTANRSWNYVGNPYPCYYDIFYMDFTAPITVWNGSTYQAYSIADDEFVLRPMQSFFVQKPDAVDQILFHKEGRQLTTDIVHAAGSRAAQVSSRHLFNIQIENGEQSDVTRVVINDNASMDYELACDAAKFMSFEANVPQIYTLDSYGNSYAINERPLDNGKVQVAYYAGQEGYYTISAQRADGEVTLYDAELNKTVDLAHEGYTFHSDATSSANSSRFTLTFKVSNGGATGIEEISNLESQTSNLFDLQGRKTSATHKGLYIQNGKKVVRK